MMMAAFAASCAGKTSGNDGSVPAQDAETAPFDLTGRWDIENVVIDDSTYVRPSEAVPGVSQYMTFDGGEYYIHTNCNSISGSYVQSGDSLRLGDGAMTEMACDNMDVEDILRRVLPNIATIDVQSDSVVRLNGAAPAECILLRRAAGN